MKIHELKIEPQYFEMKKSETKPWEIRKNDRDFKEGYVLFLREWSDGVYTGRVIYQTVDSVFSNDEFLQPGYVILTGSVSMEVN